MIDIEKFICSLLRNFSAPSKCVSLWNIYQALKDQGLKYKDGKIVKIEPTQEPKFKVDDTIKYFGERQELSESKHTIKEIKNDMYVTTLGALIPLRYEGNYELVEQKPAGKVELKFKVGDWVVNRFGDVWHIDSFDSKNYQVSNGDRYCYFQIEKQDEMRLWAIQDARDGDVLVDEDNNIGIYKEIEGIFWDSYIYLGCDGKLRGFSIGGSHEQTDTHPATKKQRDTLFAKIKEAGYIFDKDLKKIKQEESIEFKREYRKAIEDIKNWLQFRK